MKVWENLHNDLLIQCLICQALKSTHPPGVSMQSTLLSLSPTPQQQLLTVPVYLR